MKRSGALAASAIVSLTALLGGCGNNETPPDPAAADNPAAPTSSAAPPKVVHLTAASFVPAAKKAMTSHPVIRMTIRMTNPGDPTTTMTGVVKTGRKPAMSMVIKDPSMGGQSKLIVVNDRLYMSMPGLTPAGKYVKVNAKDSSDPLASALGEMTGEIDPNKTFAGFEAGLKKATYVKRETIEGEQLTRYKLTLNTKDVLKAQGMKVPAGLPATITYDVWLDSDNMMRRFEFKFSGVKTMATMKPGTAAEAARIKAPGAEDIVSR